MQEKETITAIVISDSGTITKSNIACVTFKSPDPVKSAIGNAAVAFDCVNLFKFTEEMSQIRNNE